MVMQKTIKVTDELMEFLIEISVKKETYDETIKRISGFKKWEKNKKNKNGGEK